MDVDASVATDISASMMNTSSHGTQETTHESSPVLSNEEKDKTDSILTGIQEVTVLRQAFCRRLGYCCLR